MDKQEAYSLLGVESGDKLRDVMDATMILRVDTSKRKDMTEKINEEIRSTLDSARTYHE